MIYLAKKSRTWKLRLRTPGGGRVDLSTGCKTEEDAREVEAMVGRWRGDKGQKFARPDVMALLIEKRVKLADAYEAALLGADALDALVERTTAAASVVDLWPLVDEWVKAKARGGKGAKSAPAYLRDLLITFPRSDPFTLETFTRAEISRRLANATARPGGGRRKKPPVPASGPTKNRRKAALSSFGAFLVEREVIKTNPVREVTGAAEHDPRAVYYEAADAKRLIAGMGQPHAAASAFALAFAAEWSAIAAAQVADVDLASDPVRARVRGTKRRSRDRVVPLVPELAWTLDYLRPALVGKMPTALVFDGLTEKRLLVAQRRTARESRPPVVAVGEAEQGAHSLHDWRRTHAVILCRAGYSDRIAARHLGHKDVTMIQRVYGLFEPTALDYAKAPPKVAGAKKVTSR